MKAILKDGTTRELSGADIMEISVSVLDDTLIIVMHSGEVLLAKSLHAKNETMKVDDTKYGCNRVGKASLCETCAHTGGYCLKNRMRYYKCKDYVKEKEEKE